MLPGDRCLPQKKQRREKDEPEVLLKGDLPPDRYLAHRPKMAKREACQQAKMSHRQCRRSLGETRAVRHNAKKFGEVIAMDHLSSDGELGQSLSRNVTALVVRDISLDGFMPTQLGPNAQRRLLHHSNTSRRTPKKSGTLHQMTPRSIRQHVGLLVTDTEHLHPVVLKQTVLLKDLCRKHYKAHERCCSKCHKQFIE